MKKNIFLIFCVSVLCFMTAIVGFAQNDSTLKSAAGDLYIISAKAGGVNYVEGRVSIQRANGESGYLVKGDVLEVGDKVTTSANARAEVLLNPGSFVRLDQNSEFEFLTTSLNDLKLQIIKGSAIFEVFASNDFKVTVSTPRAKFYLIDTGVYRVDVLNNDVGKIEVHRGKAQVGSLSAETLKQSRTATVNDSDVAVAKFDRKDNDAFEEWSESRAKLIAKANKKLSEDRLQNSLLGSNNRFNCYNSFGLWVYNAQYSSHSFLPYGYGWRSPYGHSFGTSTSVCNYPSYYDYWRPRFPRNGGGGSPTGTPTNTVPAENVARGNRINTPPFRRMENSGNVEVRGTASGRGFDNFPSTTRGSGSTRSSDTGRTNTTTSSPPAPAPPRRSTTPPLSGNSRTKNQN